MTTLQKTVVALTIASLAGVGIYEAHQNSRLREQVQMLEQQQVVFAAQIEDLRMARDQAINQLAAIQEETARLSRNPGEILRLRGEIARLRSEKVLNDQKQYLTSLSDTDPIWSMDYEVIQRAPPALFVRTTHFTKSGQSTAIRGEQRLVGKNSDFRSMMKHVFELHRPRTVFPTTQTSTRYDYVSTVPNQPRSSLQKEIQQQLGVTLATEEREVDCYTFTLNPQVEPKRIRGAGIEITSYPQLLRMCEEFMNKPIVDQAGLSTQSEIYFAWPVFKNYTNHELAREELRVALRERLGVDLILTKTQVEMTVVNLPSH